MVKTKRETLRKTNLSVRRVTQYRQSIFRKLGCKNITSAIIVGIRFGVIKEEGVLVD